MIKISSSELKDAYFNDKDRFVELMTHMAKSAIDLYKHKHVTLKDTDEIVQHVHQLMIDNVDDERLKEANMFSYVFIMIKSHMAKIFWERSKGE